MSAPGESAMSLKECALPRARTLSLTATRRRSSSTVAGRCTSFAPKVMLPAQLISSMAVPSGRAGRGVDHDRLVGDLGVVAHQDGLRRRLDDRGLDVRGEAADRLHR